MTVDKNGRETGVDPMLGRERYDLGLVELEYVWLTLHSLTGGLKESSRLRFSAMCFIAHERLHFMKAQIIWRH